MFFADKKRLVGELNNTVFFINYNILVGMVRIDRIQYLLYMHFHSSPNISLAIASNILPTPSPLFAEVR